MASHRSSSLPSPPSVWKQVIGIGMLALAGIPSGHAWSATVYYHTTTITTRVSSGRQQGPLTTITSVQDIVPTQSPIPAALASTTTFIASYQLTQVRIELPTSAGSPVPPPKHSHVYHQQTYTGCTSRSTDDGTLSVSSSLIKIFPPTSAGVTLTPTTTITTIDGWGGPLTAAVVDPAVVDAIALARASFENQPTNCARATASPAVDYTSLCEAEGSGPMNGTLQCGDANRCCYRCSYMRFQCDCETQNCPADPGPFWRCQDGRDYYLNGTVSSELTCISGWDRWLFGDDSCLWNGVAFGSVDNSDPNPSQSGSGPSGATPTGSIGDGPKKNAASPQLKLGYLLLLSCTTPLIALL